MTRLRLQLAAMLALIVGWAVPGCGQSSRDLLAEIRHRGELRWGGDEEGGGPYIFRAEDKSNRLVGFEIDLMDLLASRLQVASCFKQGQWSALLNELNAGNIDCVVNGYELTAERLRTCIATIPYFIYELYCFSRADDRSLMNWDDFRKQRPGGGKWTVGVLEATAADQVMSEKFADHVTVRRYSGTTEAFRDLKNSLIDATVTDTPAAAFYGPQFPVKQVGEPIERGYYVIYLRPGCEPLRDRLNDGLRAALSDGSLRGILTRYRLWNTAQEDLLRAETQQLSETMRPDTGSENNWSVVGRYWPFLLKAAWTTIKLTLISMPIAMVLGLGIALIRVYAPAPIRWPFTVYVEVVRGTPLLLQLLFIYFGLLPLLGIAKWPYLRENAAFIASVIGLSFNYAAYEAEIYRAGLLAIPIGQTEAALALGLTRAQSIRHIVVPQAVRLVVPPVTNDFINLFKDTAVCSVITVVDLSKMYNIAVSNTPRAFAELALVTAGLYLLMSYPLSLLARRLERPMRAVR